MLALVYLGCGSDDGGTTENAGAGSPSGLTGGTTVTESGGAIALGTGGAAGVAPGTGGGGPTAGETGGTETTAGSGGEPTDALCPNGTAEESLIITSAAQLATASGCTKVKGDLMLLGEDIDNIEILSSLTTVEGSVVMQQIPLASVQPLSQLTFVGKGLELFGLVNLANLEGLGALTNVGGKITISENDSLVDLHGLASLTSMGAAEVLNLKKNPSLPTCEAKWLVEKLGRSMDTGDPNVEVCSTAMDSCGGEECDPET